MDPLKRSRDMEMMRGRRGTVRWMVRLSSLASVLAEMGDRAEHRSRFALKGRQEYARNGSRVNHQGQTTTRCYGAGCIGP
jgi:hypothetical protein